MRDPLLFVKLSLEASKKVIPVEVVLVILGYEQRLQGKMIREEGVLRV
jgi:hypothetical protein